MSKRHTGHKHLNWASMVTFSLHHIGLQKSELTLAPRLATKRGISLILMHLRYSSRHVIVIERYLARGLDARCVGGVRFLLLNARNALRSRVRNILTASAECEHTHSEWECS